MQPSNIYFPPWHCKKSQLLRGAGRASWWGVAPLGTAVISTHCWPPSPQVLNLLGCALIAFGDALCSCRFLYKETRVILFLILKAGLPGLHVFVVEVLVMWLLPTGTPGSTSLLLVQYNCAAFVKQQGSNHKHKNSDLELTWKANLWNIYSLFWHLEGDTSFRSWIFLFGSRLIACGDIFHPLLLCIF